MPREFVPQINSEDLNIIWQNKNMLNCMRCQCSYGPPVNFFTLNKLLRLCFLRAWSSRNTAFLALFQHKLTTDHHGKPCFQYTPRRTYKCLCTDVGLGWSYLVEETRAPRGKPLSLDRQTVPCNMLMLETEARLK